MSADIKCQICGKVRTNEPDYTAMQPIFGRPLGWYSIDNEEICPEDITKIMNTGNETDVYVPWKEE